MRFHSVVPMRIAKIGYIAMSAVFCVVGAMLITFPAVLAMFMGTVIGIAMLLFGCIKLVGYFSRDLYRLAFQYDFQFGILLIVLGLVILVRPSDVVQLICISVGIVFLTEGMFKIQISMEARKFGIRQWWAILGFSVLTGMIGLVLVFWPSESIHVLAVLLGISLIIGAVLNLCLALWAVKIINHQYPDTIDDDYAETEDMHK